MFLCIFDLVLYQTISINIGQNSVINWRVYGGGGKTATPEVLKIFLSQFLPKLGAIHLDLFLYVCTHAKSLQSCPTLGDSKNHCPLSIGSSRQQYWVVAIPSSRGSSQPRDWTHISCISCVCKQVLYHYCYLRSPVFLSAALQISYFRFPGRFLLQKPQLKLSSFLLCWSKNRYTANVSWTLSSYIFLFILACLTSCT